MRASLNRKRQSGGFSLAEVLVATAIFAMLMVAALMIYDRSNRVFKTGVESGDMQQNTRIGFEKLVADVRMAGYDFDRDGEPSIQNSYQQPDEQLEYVGLHAVTMRGNYDAELSLTGDVENGRDTAYEPAAGQFPLVTTGNDEIVTYALKSDNGPNTDNIVFYADTRKPRKTYPGGADEQTVTIPGVNLCTGGCLNPPYTLYRITLVENDLTNPAAASNFVYTPIANNIRSLEFHYFSDPAGTTEVTPNGGTGKVLVSSNTPLADIAARAVRETILSVRVSLVGMNATPALDYVSPIEAALPSTQQVADAKSYRQIALQSLIVPRNLGRRGMEEYATTPPGAPTVTGVEYGCCGIILVKWSPPPSGLVDGYSIIYDTSPTGTFGSVPVQSGTNLFGYVSGLDPTLSYYFMVVASNSYGSQRSNNFYPASGVKPINRTNAGPPTDVTATADPAGNKISLAFKPPLANTSSDSANLTLSGGSSAAQIAVAAEITGYDIYRSRFTGFTPPGSGTVIWNQRLEDAGAPAYNAAGSNYTFTDAAPKMNCTPYYYRIRAWEKCRAAATQNEPANIEVSNGDWSSEFTGQSTAAAIPATPGPITLASSSTCSTDPCQITMSWPKVTLDLSTPQATIQVPKYQVKRVTLVGGTPVTDANSPKIFSAATTPSLIDSSPSTAGSMTFLDNTAPKPAVSSTVYSYSVQAQQACTPAMDSAYSTPKMFPCMTVTVTPPAGLLDGNGTAGSPWVIVSPAGVVGVTASQNIVSATANLFVGSTQVGTLTPIWASGPPATNVSFSVPLAANDGTTYRLDMYMTDAAGCTDLQQVYLYDSPTGCCLAPWKKPDGSFFDSTILRDYTSTPVAVPLSTSGTWGYSGSDRFAILTFRNLCSEVLTIKSLTVWWDTSAGQKLTGVIVPDTTGSYTGFAVPSSAGGTSPFTISPTGGATFPATMKMTIPAAGTTTPYKVQINLGKSGALADIGGAFGGFCVTYDRVTTSGVIETNSACRIEPKPAVTSGTCNP